MNLIGSYQHYRLMREAFPLVPRCHQDKPYFQSWLVNHSEIPAEFQLQTSYSAEVGSPGPVRKERRRTESINTAFAELRGCIPNVPADTKLSKIKTLRLATSYIAYLTDVLAQDSAGAEEFSAEFKTFDSRNLKRKREMNEGQQESLGHERKRSGRSGWPQHVWALELSPG
uniref:BHLH domain-containing protein n=1 Tax=Electrophorus electricus TaxID=8005 RepID=A0AAY5ERD0_ELEEL